MTRSKLYFASDFHLGVPDYKSSREREEKIVRWLDMCSKDAKAIYLVGDIFDFWFEYKRAVPKGYIRLLGKLAELSDAGIELHLFLGNHDMWMFDYLPKEIDCQIHKEPIQIEENGVKMYVGHGDGLGPGDRGYKFLKKVFRNRVCQWLFARLHPNFGIWLAQKSSNTSRNTTKKSDQYKGDENEWLAIYAKQVLEKEHFDYFVFGHRHLKLDIDLGNGSRYYNLGEWMSASNYAEFDGDKLHLKSFEA